MFNLEINGKMVLDSERGKENLKKLSKKTASKMVEVLQKGSEAAYELANKAEEYANSEKFEEDSEVGEGFETEEPFEDDSETKEDAETVIGQFSKTIDKIVAGAAEKFVDIADAIVKKAEEVCDDETEADESICNTTDSDPVDSYYESDEYIEDMENAKGFKLYHEDGTKVTFYEFLDQIYYDKFGKTFDFDRDFKTLFTDIYIYSSTLTIEALKVAICMKNVTFQNIFNELKKYHPELKVSQLRTAMAKDFNFMCDLWYAYTDVYVKEFYPYAGEMTFIKFFVKKARATK